MTQSCLTLAISYFAPEDVTCKLARFHPQGFGCSMATGGGCGTSHTVFFQGLDGSSVDGGSPLTFADPGGLSDFPGITDTESSCVQALLENNHWWPLGERRQVQGKEKEQAV